MSKSVESFLDHVGQTNEHPFLIEVDRAEGIYIWDKEGKRYTDLIAGVAVNNIGHRNPAVVQAIQKQIDRYLHVMVYGEFVQDPQNNLAKLLADHYPSPLSMTYFTNSGTEANEAALKLAKRVTGRHEIISFRGSYHGSTHGSLSVSGNETKKEPFRPLLPGVRFIEFNSIEELELINKKTAAVIIETIQGDAGVRIPSQEFMKALRQKCTEEGALLIFDEIQAGMGRTGKLFAFEHYDVVPDVVTMGKALGGGMPIGAFAASKNHMLRLTKDPMLGHITTFGGHPVICAAAHAGLQFLLQNGTIDRVEEKGGILESYLAHPKVKEIRRKGMMYAIDLDSPKTVQKVVDRCLERGIITFWFLSCPASFRLSPPLTITEEEIHDNGKIIREVLDEVL